MKENDKDDALRMIAEGRRQAESRRIRNLCGELDEKPFEKNDLIRTWAIDPERQIPFPPVSAVEVASIAANLIPPQYSERAACEAVVRLIRESAVLIENEKERDRKTQGLLEDNESNGRMWRNLGDRIKEINPGPKSFWESSPYAQHGRDSFSSTFPFPISMAELFRLAGLNYDAGRKRIETTLKKWNQIAYEQNRNEAEQKGEPVPAAPSSNSHSEYVKAVKKDWKERGIFQPAFLSFAADWPELQRVLAECRRKRTSRSKKSV